MASSSSSSSSSASGGGGGGGLYYFDFEIFGKVQGAPSPSLPPSPRALFCDLAGDCGGVCELRCLVGITHPFSPLPPPFLRIAMQACFFASRSSVSLWVERKTTLRFSFFFLSLYPFWVVSYLAVSDAPNPALPHPPWALGLLHAGTPRSTPPGSAPRAG